MTSSSLFKNLGATFSGRYLSVTILTFGDSSRHPNPKDFYGQSQRMNSLPARPSLLVPHFIRPRIIAKILVAPRNKCSAVPEFDLAVFFPLLVLLCCGSQPHSLTHLLTPCHEC